MIANPFIWNLVQPSNSYFKFLFFYKKSALKIGVALNTIFNENDITVLFGDDVDYFETFDMWLNQ